MDIIHENVTQPRNLKDNEYYVLMVVDYNKELRKRNDFINFDKGYIGLECTSENRVYISKTFNSRKNPYRGITCIVDINSADKVYNLD